MSLSVEGGAGVAMVGGGAASVSPTAQPRRCVSLCLLRLSSSFFTFHIAERCSRSFQRR